MRPHRQPSVRPLPLLPFRPQTVIRIPPSFVAESSVGTSSDTRPSRGCLPTPASRPLRASRSPRGDARSCGEAAVGYGLVPSHVLGPLAPSRCARDRHTVCLGRCVGGSRVECENSGTRRVIGAEAVVPALFENVLLRLEGESL